MLLLWVVLMVLALASAGSGLLGWKGLAWSLAGLKGLLVSERLMELRHAPWRWRVLGPLWLLLSVGGILLLGA